MIDPVLQDVVTELSTLGERLTELAMERLREAAGGNAGEAAVAVADERRLNRARQAIERAMAILSPEVPEDGQACDGAVS